VAGIWCGVGKSLGMTGGQLLYWVRFLNVPLFTLLVWFSYWLGRMFYSKSAIQRIGLPLLVAFFPQDVFYSVNSDAISSLLFVISFFLLLRIYFENKSAHYYLLTGLAVAATLLVKISNVAVLALLCVIIVLKVRKLSSEKRIREYLPRFIILLTATAVPIGIWLTRNYLVFGDVTGTTEKINHLGWTVKPLSKLFDHPIFTIKGMFYFLAELTKSFWRGEIVWHLEPMSWWGTDLFYVVSSAVFIIACGIGIILKRDKTNQKYRFVLVMSFLVVFVSLAFLAFVSILYDFNGCWYPSQEKPYLVSGRLIIGALLPFLLIYNDGLNNIFQRLGRRVVLLVIVVVVSGIILSELWLNTGIFSSSYNWFHLK
jgi:4-amino-4-deoxy-L-arabinose transferase-like glycosyltransferase